MRTPGILLAAVAVMICAQSFADTAFDVAKLKGRDNLGQTPLGNSGQWSLEKILALTPAEVLELWRGLPAPPMQEMNGHYMGLRPDTGAGGLFPNAKLFDEKKGYWLGKAFRPVTDTVGEGYNRMRLPGSKVKRVGRMRTRIDKSLVDGKPAFILDYAAINKKSTLMDELRKLDDSIYLGVGTMAEKDGKRTAPDMFILIGPTDEWVGADSP